MRLPVEVLEAIIDQASDNLRTVRRLSLTCAVLLPRSRRHLFKNIVIRTVEQLESSHVFLDSRPWLVALVREVTLLVHIPYHNSKPNLRLLDVAPIHLLNRLPNLRVWTMGAKDGYSRVRPSLSLHRIALRCYQNHANRIQSLELSGIVFDSLSDFRGLVSAFTTIDTLACYNIDFKPGEREHPDSSLLTAAGAKIPPLPISTLKVSTTVDSRALEYLLVCNSSDLKHLILYLGVTHYDKESYAERMEQSIAQLTSLSSLTLVVYLSGYYWRMEHYFSQALLSAAKILERVNRDSLAADVRVEFKADPVANLGIPLSRASGSTSLDACKRLEAALLAFSNGNVVVRDPFRRRRAGRAAFWTPVIRRAFPRLDERSSLIFKFMPSKDGVPDPLGHEDKMTSMVISHDSARVVTSSSDGTIILWDLASQTIVQEWPAHPEVLPTTATALALSPDGRRLASAGGSRTLAVWGIDADADSDVARKAADLEGHSNMVTACAWSPDGALIASASLDMTVRIWDGRTYREREVLPLAPISSFVDVDALQFSPDARRVAWISGEKHCCVVWMPLTVADREHWQQVTLRSHPDPGRGDVETTAFSFDRESRRIATAHGTRDGGCDPKVCVVRIWDAATGAPLAVLWGHSKTVSNVSFSSDGRSLLSVSSDMSVRIWECETWSARGQHAGVLGVAKPHPDLRSCFRHDGKYIATGSPGGRVQLWRTGDWSCVATFDEHRGDVMCMSFSPNGEFLVSGDCRGIVHIRCLSNFLVG